jgi:hypothetical protein
MFLERQWLGRLEDPVFVDGFDGQGHDFDLKGKAGEHHG